MKITLLAIAFTISGLCNAQNCNFGNDDSTGFDNSGDPIYQDYLLGSKIQLNSSGTLYSLNLIGRNTGAQVQMALYDDNSGIPGNLIITSDTTIVTTVGTGIVSLPVVPTQLAAGDYWIMAVYSIDGGHTYSRDTTHQVYYIALNYGSTIPASAINFIGYTGSEFTYFMEVSCNTSDVKAIDAVDFDLYPNPAEENITINFPENFSETPYKIFNTVGQNVLKGKLTQSKNTIDVSHLTGGVYFFETGNQKRARFLKN